MSRNRHHDPELQHARGSGLRGIDFAWLLDQDVPGRLSAWPAATGFDLILRDVVLFGRGGRFEFARNLRDPGAERVVAYTLLARDAAGSPLDVVAWHPKTTRVATWLGQAGLLGAEYPCPATADDPLLIYPDPAAWMADGRRGVVVVDERLGRADLLLAGSIRAGDIDHGTKLKAMLSKVRLPSILVPAATVPMAAA
ncbi:hypothetical protein ASF28_09045 [Methylobacterium sp. Leaf99]|uniref:hypothetical protein n=1 Tax=Methylobacterium sp. Leaf99 TaxID=1736251 RepID=UPI0006F525B1|nr:hypothetical protein [Methylobacterium sp. Leaf99]KQP11180.1 hypothetical protein ASF28_09045 [Methylobacterium sp. Leaf99]